MFVKNPQTDSKFQSSAGLLTKPELTHRGRAALSELSYTSVSGDLCLWNNRRNSNKLALVSFYPSRISHEITRF